MVWQYNHNCRLCWPWLRLNGFSDLAWLAEVSSPGTQRSHLVSPDLKHAREPSQANVIFLVLNVRCNLLRSLEEGEQQQEHWLQEGSSSSTSSSRTSSSNSSSDSSTSTGGCNYSSWCVQHSSLLSCSEGQWA